MNEFIKRTKRTANFTIINNEIFHEDKMSLDSKGLLCYILSLPDDWIVYKSELMDRFKIGRRIIERIFKEIELSGYLCKVKLIRDNGKFDNDNYIFYDNPQLYTDVQNVQRLNSTQSIDTVSKSKDSTDVHLPTAVNVHLLSTNLNKELKNKELRGFDDFWLLYDKKVDKPKAQAKWSKLTQQDKEKIMQYIPKYKISQPDIKFRKDPCTFLNNKSWENEIYNQIPQSNKIIFPR